MEFAESVNRANTIRGKFRISKTHFKAHELLYFGKSTEKLKPDGEITIRFHISARGGYEMAIEVHAGVWGF